MRSVKELGRLASACRFGELRGFVTAAEVHVASGAPAPTPGRKVTIFAPAKTSMSSGKAQTVEGGGSWKLSYPVEGKWVNPLMGWTSTADHVETMARQLYFDSKEAAIAFAERHRMEWEVQAQTARAPGRPKRYQGYGDNFTFKRKGYPVGGLRSELGAKK